MQANGVKKMPGTCSIELNGETHVLIAGSTTHPKYKEIKLKLEQLSNQLQQVGYIPDTAHTLELMDEPDKLLILCFHSEKMALALGLISTPPGTPLMIATNFRVCPDCHETTKRIAQLEQRVITVCDANRVHVFKHGNCSCNDYF